MYMCICICMYIYICVCVYMSYIYIYMYIYIYIDRYPTKWWWFYHLLIQTFFWDIHFQCLQCFISRWSRGPLQFESRLVRLQELYRLCRCWHRQGFAEKPEILRSLNFLNYPTYSKMIQHPKVVSWNMKITCFSSSDIWSASGRHIRQRRSVRCFVLLVLRAQGVEGEELNAGKKEWEQRSSQANFLWFICGLYIYIYIDRLYDIFISISPLVIQHSHGKLPIYRWFSHENFDL